jgi:hypothetical protein
MKLDEMGVMGREVKIADGSPSHGGELGKIITISTERAYVAFKNGDKEWISNKYIVGTRAPASEHVDFDQHPLTEMAAKKQCEHCGKTMAANHYWYKGGWKCKKAKDAAPADDKKSDTADNKAASQPASKPEKKAKPQAEFPHMSDEVYDKLDKAGQAAQDAKEQAYYKSHGRTGPQDYTPKDANEKAATDRARKLHAELTKGK